MLRNLLLASVLLAVQVRAAYHEIYCEPENATTVVNFDDDGSYVVFSNGYPSSTNQGCSLKLTTNQSRWLYVQYLYASYDTPISYTTCYGGTLNFSSMYTTDAALDKITKASLEPGKEFKITFSQPYGKHWNGFELLLMAFVPNGAGTGRCALGGTTTIAVTDTTLIIGNPYSSEEYSSSNCQWNLKTVDDNDLLVAKLVLTNMTSGETLKITGEIDGVNTTKIFSGLANHSEVLYYRYNMSIHYERPEGYFETEPFIIVTPTKSQSRNCSLPFDNVVYTNRIDNFTNIIPQQRYQKNQHCVWKVNMPEKTIMYVRIHEDDALPLTGDRLLIMSPTENITYKAWPNAQDNIVNGSATQSTDVIFSWETDGVDEFNGFSIDYLIKDWEPSDSGCGTYTRELQFSGFILSIFASLR